jgi:excisionase family DNA binding protein
VTPEDLEAVRRVVAEELDAALARHAPPRRARAGLLTLDEVAAVCHVSAETARHWICEGRLKAYKPGRYPLVREADLLAFIEANETRAKRVARRGRRHPPTGNLA